MAKLGKCVMWWVHVSSVRSGESEVQENLKAFCNFSLSEDKQNCFFVFILTLVPKFI